MIYKKPVGNFNFLMKKEMIIGLLLFFFMFLCVYFVVGGGNVLKELTSLIVKVILPSSEVAANLKHHSAVRYHFYKDICSVV